MSSGMYPDTYSKTEIHAWLMQRISQELTVDMSELDPLAPLTEYGMGSVQAVQLSGELAEWLERELNPTLFYDYPSIESIAAFLASEAEPLAAGIPGPEVAATASLAIVGIGCRFPGGANDPDSLWQLLVKGVDAIREIPLERWDIEKYYDPDPVAPGKMNTRWGGFLTEIDLFDPGFFNLSPREAEQMDPQQRLLLEVAWEAFEDAGIPVSRVSGTRMGVFIGISTNDYSHFQIGDPTLTDPYAGSGNALSIAANRLSYFLGVHGPSLAVDTACSSSLVAVHLACRSISAGESSLALAGGVNLIFSPGLTINFSKAGFMAPDGRCKTFDEKADGYVRSEGAGLVILKPLEQAMQDGNRIYAVIRGSAVNHDGRSNGLTAPSRQAQEDVILQACRHAGISPGSIQYVEAHGTGTFLGDQIEAGALANVLSMQRPAGEKCIIGSLKTNLGSLEAAAGIAGLIKTALILKHKMIPPNLHYRTPNPHIPLASIPLIFPSCLTAWPESDPPALAGVSSFGFGGTNAHILLEETPAFILSAEENRIEPERAYLLPLSARNAQVLAQQAGLYRDFLSAPQQTGGGVCLTDICYTAATGRTHFPCRIAITGCNRRELIAQLGSLAASGPGSAPGSKAPGLAPGCKAPEVVFVFSGQESRQPVWRGEFLQREPRVLAVLKQCARVVSQELGWSLTEELRRNDPAQWPPGAEPIIRFSLQAALCALWKSWGIMPAAVIGSGIGELAAFHAAGCLSLEEAVRILVRVSKITPDLSFQEACRLAEPGEQQTADFPVYPASTGLKSRRFDASAWRESLGNPPGLKQLSRRLQSDKLHIFLEIGPSAGLFAEADEPSPDLLWLASPRGQEQQLTQLFASLGRLYVEGCAVDWQALYPDGQLVHLPSYPWQKQSLWIGGKIPGKQDREAAASGGVQVAGSLYTLHWEQSSLSPDRPALQGQVLQGQVPQGQVLQGQVLQGQVLQGQVLQDDAGCWLIFNDSGSIGRGVAEQLGDDPVIFVHPAETFRKNDSTAYQLDPVAAPGYLKLLQDAFAPGQKVCRGVVFLWGLEENEAQATPCPDWEMSVYSLLYLIQALVQSGLHPLPALTVVTREACVVTGSEAIALARAPLWGMGRVVIQEHPELCCRLIDICRENPAELPKQLARELLVPEGENQLALRSGIRYAARLQPAGPEDAAPAPVIDPEGTYLITGGLGGLGLTVARWLAGEAAGSLVLCSRSRPGEETLRQLDLLAKTGTKVYYRQADVADRAQIGAVFEFIASGLPPLKGIIHAAGVLADGLLLRLTREDFEKVMPCKLQGAWNLHQLSLTGKLDFFVLFSSMSSLLGTPGQGNYCAANAFLDALAHYRRQLGLPALSLNWGPWAEVGMNARLAGNGKSAYTGIGSITPRMGLEALQRLLAQSAVQVGVFPVDWARWQEAYPHIAASSLFASILKSGPGPAPSARAVSSLRGELTAIPPGHRRRAMLESHITTEICRIFKIQQQQVDRETPLGSFGFDSILALELRNRFEASLEVSLPVTMLWSGHSTIGKLADYLAARLELPLDAEQQTGTQAVNLRQESTFELTISQTIDRIDQLSDTEALRLLLNDPDYDPDPDRREERN